METLNKVEVSYLPKVVTNKFSKMPERIVKFAHEIEAGFTSVWGVLVFAAMQIFLFFEPIKFNIYLVGGLIVADIVTALFALFAQKKRGSKNSFEAFCKFYDEWQSARAFDSVVKFTIYSLLVLVAYGIGNLFGQAMELSKLASGLIAYVEFKSILENADRAMGTKLLPTMLGLIKEKITTLEKGEKKNEGDK